VFLIIFSQKHSAWKIFSLEWGDSGEACKIAVLFLACEENILEKFFNKNHVTFPSIPLLAYKRLICSDRNYLPHHQELGPFRTEKRKGLWGTGAAKFSRETMVSIESSANLPLNPMLYQSRDLENTVYLLLFSVLIHGESCLAALLCLQTTLILKSSTSSSPSGFKEGAFIANIIVFPCSYRSHIWSKCDGRWFLIDR
jgi:hypothetical protein